MSYKSSYTGAEIDAAIGKSATSSTDNAVVRFDGTSGAMQDSNTFVDDSGNLTVYPSSGNTTLTVRSDAGVPKVSLTNSAGTSSIYGGLGGSKNFTFYPDASPIVRIDSDGLKFNGDTAAANALDDYEEGTFTPYLNGDNGGAFAGSTSGSGHYTKIGNVVHCVGTVTWTANGTSGALRMYGLPFTSNSGEYANIPTGYDWIYSSLFDSQYVNNGVTHTLFWLNGAVVNSSGMPTSGSMTFTFFYKVS